MQDRVADVLAQRAALDRGAGAGIALSICLHAALTGAALWGAFQPKTAAPPGNLQIQFAPMPAPVRPASKRTAPRIEAPQPEVEKPKPLPKPVEPAKDTAPPSPFGRSNKKPSETAAPPKPTPSAPAAPAAPGADIAVGSSGVTGLEGGDFPYTMYIENMKRLIGQRWYRPPSADGSVTTVYFVINRNGQIRDAATRESSGNGTFDRAALRAVLEASPLPPLPFGYNGTFLGVHLTFK